jgi:hypothetical protein
MRVLEFIIGGLGSLFEEQLSALGEAQRRRGQV